MKAVKIIFSLIILLFVLLVVGIYVRNKAVGPVGWAQDDVTRRLEQRMKDPHSMIIRSSFVIQRQGSTGATEISICGIVDGKNSYGGYSGGQRFASLSYHDPELKTFDTQSVEIEDSAQKATAERLGILSTFEKVYWNSRCVDATHPPLSP